VEVADAPAEMLGSTEGARQSEELSMPRSLRFTFVAEDPND
jgi:hypothetical protein